MKFCPECGSLTEGKEYCPSCGLVLKDFIEERKKTAVVNEPSNFDMELETKIREINFNGRTFVTLDELKSHKLDYGKLESFSYNTSGGMSGENYSATVDFKEKTFTISDQPSHMADKTITVYKASDDTLKKIEKFIKDINLPVWSRIEVNTIFRAYDAPSGYTNIRYDKKSFSIDKLIFVDDEELELLKELNELVYSLKDDNNKISEEVIPRAEVNKNIGMMNGFVGMGMMGVFNNQNPQEYEPNKFCPECGAPKVKDSKNCACGYTYKD